MKFSSYTNLPFMETHFREKKGFHKWLWVSIMVCNLQGDGFPLHGNFWQNLKICFQPKKLKIFAKFSEFYSKLHVQGSIIGQRKS